MPKLSKIFIRIEETQHDLAVYPIDLFIFSMLVILTAIYPQIFLDKGLDVKRTIRSSMMVMYCHISYGSF